MNTIRFLALWVVGVMGGAIHAASVEAGGYRFNVSLVPDSPSIMLGEPTWVTFRIENPSDVALTFGRDLPAGTYLFGASFQYPLQAIAADGHAVPSGPAGGGGGTGAGREVLVPAKGEFSYRVFVPAWVVLEKPGRYTLICRRNPQIPNSPADRGPGASLSLEARVEIEVTAPDQERMGALIARLGNRLLNVVDTVPVTSFTGLSSFAGFGPMPDFINLSAISDERAVAYWVRLYRLGVTRGSDAAAFTALQTLGKFDAPEALDTLQAGLKIGPAELSTIKFPDDAIRTAETIRREAAGALRRSKSARAKTILDADSLK